LLIQQSGALESSSSIQLTETGVVAYYRRLRITRHNGSYMTFLVRCLISVLPFAVSLFSQSLLVPPSRTDLKTPGVFSVTLDSPPGKAPVALQWEFSIPTVIVISIADITIGKAAESARKSLTCATRPSKPPRQRRMRVACILAGGANPITDGPIAVVQYHAQWDVEGAQIRVAVENILGVSVDLKPIPIPNVDEIIDIR
jgi:hypothetical protein